MIKQTIFLKEHESFGVVENINADSDPYSRVAGVALKVNSPIMDDYGRLVVELK